MLSIDQKNLFRDRSGFHVRCEITPLVAGTENRKGLKCGRVQIIRVSGRKPRHLLREGVVTVLLLPFPEQHMRRSKVVAFAFRAGLCKTFFRGLAQLQ